MTAPNRADFEALTAELFRSVESAQGAAFISDGDMVPAGASRKDFFDRVRSRLYWSNESTKKIRAFLRKHGELP